MFQNIRFPKHLGPDLLEKNMRLGSSSKAITRSWTEISCYKELVPLHSLYIFLTYLINFFLIMIFLKIISLLNTKFNCFPCTYTVSEQLPPRNIVSWLGVRVWVRVSFRVAGAIFHGGFCPGTTYTFLGWKYVHIFIFCDCSMRIYRILKRLKRNFFVNFVPNKK